MKDKIEKPPERDLIFVGDIHGCFENIVWQITKRYQIKNADVVFCGDFGVGFGTQQGMTDLYNHVHPRLEEADIKLWALRGNHDDPSYFDGGHNYPRLVFLQDHLPITLGNGWVVYPIGGAVSIDKLSRIDENKKYERYGSSKRIWWPGERIIKKFTGLPSKVDIIATHEAPMGFEPIVINKGGLSGEIIDSIQAERDYLSWLLKEIKCKRWFHGHYHVSSSGEYLGVMYRGLGIDEIFMMPPKQNEEIIKN